MRNFDLWQNNFDQDGKFLHGKILFTERDSSGGVNVPNKNEIYDEDGTPISNPVLTGTYGKTERQVFLGDGEYTVWRYRYIGGGDFSDYELVNDDSLWELVDSFDICDKYSELQIELDESKCVKVDTVADLQSLNPELVEGETKVVWLLGYYAKGDKRPVAYRSVSSGTPNGGSIIQSTTDNTVFWKLLNPTNYVDVRDFGVFPDAAPTNVGQIANAIKYANDNGLDVYFSRGNYNFYGGTFQINGQLLLGGTAIFTGHTTNRTTVNTYRGVFPAKNLLLVAAQGSPGLTVVAPEAHTSWINNSGYCRASATDMLVVDKDVILDTTDFPQGLRKCVVTAESTHQILFRCDKIECDGKLSSTVEYSFENCNFTDRFFKDNEFSDNISLTNCRLDINDFASVDNWAKAMLMNGASVFDFQGRYCASFTLRASSATKSYKILNGNFGTLMFRAPDTVSTKGNSLELIHCRGSIYGDYLWEDLYIDDCVLQTTTSRSYHYDIDYAVDGLTVGGSITVNNSYIASANNDDYAIGCSDNAYDPQTVSITGSSISGKVCCATLGMSKSTIDNEITVESIHLEGNVFNGSTRIQVNGNSAYFVNNRFDQSGNPEDVISGTNLTSCTYDGNTGNCLKKKAKIDLSNIATPMYFTGYQFGSGVEFRVSSSNAVPVHLFGIGQSRIRVKISVDVRECENSQEVSSPSNNCHTTLSGTAIYSTPDAKSFVMPTHDIGATTIITDGSENTRYFVIGVPSGISPDGTYASFDNITLEAEIIE